MATYRQERREYFTLVSEKLQAQLSRELMTVDEANDRNEWLKKFGSETIYWTLNPDSIYKEFRRQ